MDNVLTTPFKGFTLDDVTQIFHDGHKALDLVENATPLFRLYGTPLCAVENARISRIWGDNLVPDELSDSGLKDGYGVKFVGLETGYTYTYWHTLPFLPVWGGDIVKRGQIIAFMGNAGTVYSNGVYVPLEERLVKPYKGTHLHFVAYNQRGRQIDPLPMINLNWQPQYNTADFAKALTIVAQKALVGIQKIKGQ